MPPFWNGLQGQVDETIFPGFFHSLRRLFLTDLRIIKFLEWQGELFRRRHNRVEPIGRNQWAQGVKQKETGGVRNSVS